jgi:hypothetical protein
VLLILPAQTQAEIHRLQMEHNLERQRDLEQLQSLGDFSKDAAAVREHNEALTKRVAELQAGLRDAQHVAAQHLDALESQACQP